MADTHNFPAFIIPEPFTLYIKSRFFLKSTGDSYSENKIEFILTEFSGRYRKFNFKQILKKVNINMNISTKHSFIVYGGLRSSWHGYPQDYGASTYLHLGGKRRQRAKFCRFAIFSYFVLSLTSVKDRLHDPIKSSLSSLIILMACVSLSRTTNDSVVW